MKNGVRLRVMAGLVAVSMLLLLVPSTTAFADNIVVDRIENLQTAIDSAQSGDTIVLASALDGAVLPDTLNISGGGRNLTFASETGTLTLYPPADLVEVRHIRVTDGSLSLTFDGVILDGGTNTGGIYETKAVSGGITIATGVNLTLHNAVIRNCKSGSGGAILCAQGSSLTITGDGTLITGNTAASGGAIYGTKCTITVEAGEISGNTATNGGGIAVGGPDGINSLNVSTINITGGKIINNHAVPDTPTHSNGIGGGIYVYFYSILNMGGDALISGNDANRGGGIYGDNFSVINVSGGVIRNNSVTYVSSDAQSGIGGGIYGMDGSSITVANCTISGNAAGQAGGGIGSNSVSVTVHNTLIAGNTAELYGGGIMGLSPAITIEDCEITGNTANQGGGIFSYAGYVPVNVQITGSTVISDNTATGETGTASGGASVGSGGGVFVWTRSHLTVGPNVIFARNTAPNGYAWTVDPAAGSAADNASGTHNANIQTTSFSEPFTNAYNNFDVNYKDGEVVKPAKVTVTYYQDTVGGTPLGSKTFNSYVGAQITANTAAAALGTAWNDLYKPANYNSGVVQETLPITVTAATADITVLYTESLAPTPTIAPPPTGDVSVTTLPPVVIIPRTGSGDSLALWMLLLGLLLSALGILSPRLIKRHRKQN